MKVEERIRSLTGVQGPGGVENRAPGAFRGQGLDAATAALGLKRALVGRQHALGVEMALHRLETDSARKVLERL